MPIFTEKSRIRTFASDDRISAMTFPLVVLDTNVCLDLFVFRDPASINLHSALKNGTVTAVTNEVCRAEWLRVLNYAQIPLNPISMSACIAEFDSLLSCINPSVLFHSALPVCSDADDQKFLELARDSGADFLITKDNALLKLRRKTVLAGLFNIIRPAELPELMPL